MTTMQKKPPTFREEFSWSRVNWPTTIFLLLSFLVATTLSPMFIWKFWHHLGWFDFWLFILLAHATGMSITIGYHRLFSHRTFKASWPVRLFTLIFGAGTFENSVYWWTSEHRYHHKYVDEDRGDVYDPYNIKKGFFWAHVGWLLLHMEPPLPVNNVNDLEKDKMVMWQHRHIHYIAFSVGFLLPTMIGLTHAWWIGQALWIGALRGFLIAGALRVVIVQHGTFFINSLCHMVGKQPYSSDMSPKDSALMAFLTFGEGYHNYHHTFQYDYRNGVKPWQWDPSKWAIWLMAKVGMAKDLLTVPDETIRIAEIREKCNHLRKKVDAGKLKPNEQLSELLGRLHENLLDAHRHFRNLLTEYTQMIEQKIESSRETLSQIASEMEAARDELRMLIYEWNLQHRAVLAVASSGSSIPLP